MQKKYIIPLLMASPAVSALGMDYPGLPVPGKAQDGKGWAQNVVTGDEPTFNGEGVNAPYFMSVITQSLGVLPNGSYRIVLTDADNCAIFINGKETADGSFKVDSKAAVELQIKSKDGIKGFSFSKAQLELDFPFTEADADAITAAIAAAAVTPLTPQQGEAKSDKYDSLAEQAADLEEQKKTLEEDLAAVEATLPDGTLAIYEKFFADGNKLEDALKAYQDEVKAFNEAAAAENTAYAGRLENLRWKQRMATRVEEYNTKLQKAKTLMGDVTTAYKYAENIAGYNTAAAAVAAFEAKVNETYGTIKDTPCDPATIEGLTVKDRQEIEDALDALITKINADAADAEAYSQWEALMGKMDTAYKEALNAVDAISGYNEASASNFAGLQDAAKKSLEAIVAEATDKCGTKKGEIAGAAANLEADTETINQAIADLKAKTDETVETAKAQNTAIQDANSAIAEIGTEVGKITFTTKIADLQAQFDADKKAITDAIEALQKYVDEQYAANTLDLESDAEGGYKAQSQAIADAKSTLEQRLTDYFNPVNDTFKANEEAYNGIDHTGIYGFIQEKFKNNYEATVEVLNNIIKNGEVDAATLADINKGINDMKDNAAKLLDAAKKVLDPATGLLPGFEKALSDLKANTVDNADVLSLDGNTYSDTAFKTDVIDPFEQKYNKYNTDVTNAKLLPAQECFDAFTALADDATALDAAAEATADTRTYLDGKYTANIKVCEGKIAVLETNSTGDYPMMEEVYKLIDDLSAELQAISDKLDTAKTGADDTFMGLYTATNPDFETFLDNVDNCQKTIDRYKASEQAYKDFNFEGLLTILGDDLDALRQYNADTALQPAQDYFLNEVIGTAESPADATLQAIADRIEAAVNDAHAKGTLSDKKDDGKTGAQSLKDEVDALSLEIDETEVRIKANEDAHNSEQAESQTVFKTILNYIEQIDALSTDNLDSKVRQDLDAKIAELEALRDNDLNTVDRNVANSYAVGQAKTGADGVDNEEKYIAEYDRILKTVEKIYADANSYYHGSVVDHNHDVWTEYWIDGVMVDLREKYKEAIGDYNTFLTLSNIDYRKYIKETVKTHEPIYQYSEKIRDIESALKAYHDECNGNNTVLTTDLLDANGVTTAKTYIDEMNADITGLSTQVNAKAEEFYSERFPVKKGIVTDAEAALDAAGITDDALRNEAVGQAEADLDAAAKAYENTDRTATAPEAELTATIGYVMNDIATDLDKIVKATVDENLQNVAQTYWKGEYDIAVATLEAYSKALTDKTDADYGKYQYASGEKRDAAKSAIENALTEAAGINSTATADAALINNVKADKDQLYNVLKLIDDTMTALADESKANIDEKNAVDNYNDVIIPDLQKQLSALEAYIDGMGSAHEVDVTAVRDAIANLQAEVEKGDVTTTNKQAVEDALQEVKDALADGYEDANRFEVKLLEQLVSDVKVAYNNALAHTSEWEGMADDNKAVNDLADKVSQLALNTPADADEAFKTEATGLEQALADLIVKLDGMADKNPLTPILDALNTQVTEVENGLNEGTSYLAGTEHFDDATKKAFEDRYAELQADLDKIKESITPDNNNLLSQGDNLKAALKGLADEVDALNKEVKDADQKATADAEKAQANQAAYQALSTELQGLKAALEALKERTEGFGLSDIYQAKLESFALTLSHAEEELEKAYAATGLNARSALDLGSYASAEAFGQALDATSWTVTNRYMNGRKDAATAALAAASASLRPADGKFVVPEILSELQATLQTLAEKKQETDANAADAGRTVDLMDSYIAAYNDIIAGAQAIAPEAEEYYCLYGDVNFDNVVNALDVQMIIDWIGNRVTYAELYAESKRAAEAADLNNSESINIADVQGTINIALGTDMSTVRYAMGRRMVESNNVIYAEPMTEQGATRRFAVNLNNSETFAAGEFTINLPAGMSVENITLGERTAGHSLFTYEHAGSVRVVVASFEGKTIADTDGAVVYVDVNGKGDLKVDEAIFSTPAAVAHKVANADRSMLEIVKDGLGNLKERVYNAAGQMYDKARQGFNIIRKSDGSVEKRFKK